MEEVWKDIVGYEGLYQISNLGEVKRLEKEFSHIAKDERIGKRSQGAYSRTTKLEEKILKGIKTDKGYLAVGLIKDGKSKKFRVHRLVAMMFIPNPHNKLEVNHIDGNKENNSVDNLEWSTGKENRQHALDNGFVAGRDKLSERDIEWIVENYEKGSRTNGALPISRKFGIRTDRVLRIVSKHKK